MLHLLSTCSKGLCCLTLPSCAIHTTKAQYMLIMQRACKNEWRSKPVVLIILYTDFLQDWCSGGFPVSIVNEVSCLPLWLLG